MVLCITYNKQVKSQRACIIIRDGQLEVTRGPIFRKLKSSGPEHRKQKTKVIQNIHFN